MNELNERDQTLLYLACWSGQISIVDYLLRLDGIKIDGIQDRSTESTPLHAANAGGHCEIVAMLLARGATPESTSKLLLPEQELMMSACLLSLVNYFGHHIEISARNYPSSASTKDEMDLWSIYEGAFFGNIFKPDQKKFACRGLREDLALERSPDRRWRRCTDPGYNCSMTVVGDCSANCAESADDYGFAICTGSDGVTYPAVNSFLRRYSRATTGTSNPNEKKKRRN